MTWDVRRFAVAACVAGVTGCRAPSGAPERRSSDPGASAVAAPAPLDTSWQRDPGKLLAVGDVAPDFEGIAHTGMRVRLSALLDKPAVVYFYGADKTPAAVIEATSFRDAWLRLNEKIGMVLGVSADDRIMHRDFATEEALPFLLIADEKREIARAFGVPLEDGRSKPTTFVVAKDGKIARVLSDVSPEKTAAEILAAIATN